MKYLALVLMLAIVSASATGSAPSKNNSAKGKVIPNKRILREIDGSEMATTTPLPSNTTTMSPLPEDKNVTAGEVAPVAEAAPMGDKSATKAELGSSEELDSTEELGKNETPNPDREARHMVRTLLKGKAKHARG